MGLDEPLVSPESKLVMTALEAAIEGAQRLEPTAPAPQESRWKLSDGAFIVIAIREGPARGPLVTAVAFEAEWVAHDVAESYLDLGCRTFFIDTDPEDGSGPNIEEYGRGVT